MEPGAAAAAAGKKSIRDIFETISLSVISFLEKHPGVKGVEFVERPGAAARDIARWEQANVPVQLPDDYKSFLQISDGLLLRWNIEFGGELLPLGCMHLNPIERVAPIALEAGGDLEPPDPAAAIDFDDPTASFNMCTGRLRPAAAACRAYDIDSHCAGGRVALFYPDPYKRRAGQAPQPQVRFQDAAGSWHFIAASFTDYFRLMLMHLGLPHWQYAFTDVGLDPATQQWFRFLSPERLAIDVENAKRREDRRRSRQASRGAPASPAPGAAPAAGADRPPSPGEPSAPGRLDLSAIDLEVGTAGAPPAARPKAAPAGRPQQQPRQRTQQSAFRSALAATTASIAAAAGAPAPQRPPSASRQRPASAPTGPR